MTSPILHVDNLWKEFNGKPALRGLTLSMEPGGIHGLVGSNGAGKTTLFRILLGLLSPSSGTSSILGRDSRYLGPDERARIVFVNEEHSMPRWMQVGKLARMEEYQYSLWDWNLFHQILGNFDVGYEQKIGQLSRGERAGLNLAIALAQRPTLLIMDEPTLGMDVVAKQAFLEALLFSPAGAERTILYCSHQMDEIERISDTLIVMEKGCICWQGPPDDFRHRVRTWIVDFAGPPPSSDSLPGLLMARKIDGQYHYLVLDQDEDFAALLRRKGAVSTHDSSVSLSHAINGFLAKSHAVPAPGSTTA